MDDERKHGGIDNVIITGELDRRPSRAPDHAAEAAALTTLADVMSGSPDTVLQRLVEVAMSLTRADSAGISLLEPGGDQGTFRWAVTTGAWTPYRNGTMPREASPCGEVIARQTLLLMKNPERVFPALQQANPGVGEGLLAPFHINGVPVGTVWTIKHGPEDHFQAEDARLLQSLAHFAAAAHQMEQALRRAEAASQSAELRAQQLVTLAEVSTEFFGTCDMELMPIYGNAAAMRMVGLPDLDQVRRTPLQEFFFPEDLPFLIKEFLPRVLRDGQAKVEIRLRHFVTGEPIWVDYSLVVLKDETGQMTGLGTVTQDLTNRRRAEAALHESEERLRTLFDSIDEGFAELDVVMDADNRAIDWRYVKLNQSFERLTGLKSAAGRMASEFLPNVEPEWAESITHVVNTGQSVRFEQQLADLGRWFSVYLSRIGDHGSRRIAAVFDEITARKQVEAALREREERQAFLLQLSDALRPLADPVEVQTTAARLIGNHFGVDRANYYEVGPDGWVTRSNGYVSGQVAVPEQFPIDAFGHDWAESYWAGRVDFVDDVTTDDRFSKADRDVAHKPASRRAGRPTRQGGASRDDPRLQQCRAAPLDGHGNRLGQGGRRAHLGGGGTSTSRGRAGRKR